MRNDIAERIREAVRLDEAVRHYGFTPNRAGFICCPFHHEKTPSLKIFPDNHWHCFGCGKGGSVIDFVMELFGLRFPDAVVRLNADFRLGLSAAKADPRDVARLQEKRAREKAEREAQDREYMEKVREFRRLNDAMKNAPPDSEEFAEACHKLPALEAWLDENISGDGRR